MTRARDIADLGQDKTTLASYVDTGVTSTDLERIDITTEGTSENSKVVTADSSGHVTLAGELRGPATLVIDPAVVGNNTGLLQVKGNLQVDGTTTTINSTTLTVDDKNIVLGSGAADSAAADGSGITIDGASATMLYTHSTTSFDFNKPVNVTGALTATSASFGDGNITNVGDIAVDTISSDAGTSIGVTLGTDAGDDFNVGGGKLVVEGDTGKVGIGSSAPTYKFDVVHDSQNGTIAQFGGDGGDGSFTDVRIRNTHQASSSTNEGARLIFELGNTNAGWIEAFKEADGSSAGNRTGGLAFYTTNANSTTEKMRINSSGKVGIGTDTPQALVVSKEASDTVEGINFVAEGYGDVNDTCGYYFASHAVDSPRRKAAILLKKTGDYGVGDLHFVVDSNADDASISQASDTKMTINSAGNVGIGGAPTSSASGYDGSTLNLYQSQTSSKGSQIRFTSATHGTGTGDGAFISYWSDSNLYINNQESGDSIFYNNGSERMRITSAGSITTPNGEFNGTIGSSATMPTGTVVKQTQQSFYNTMTTSVNTSYSYSTNRTTANTTSLGGVTHTTKIANPRITVWFSGQVGFQTYDTAVIYVWCSLFANDVWKTGIRTRIPSSDGYNTLYSYPLMYTETITASAGHSYEVKVRWNQNGDFNNNTGIGSTPRVGLGHSGFDSSDGHRAYIIIQEMVA